VQIRITWMKFAKVRVISVIGLDERLYIVVLHYSIHTIPQYLLILVHEKELREIETKLLRNPVMEKIVIRKVHSLAINQTKQIV
jgi:hypothetical protein